MVGPTLLRSEVPISLQAYCGVGEGTPVQRELRGEEGNLVEWIFEMVLQSSYSTCFHGFLV